MALSADFTPAFVLHQRPFRESSLLLDVFSQDYGRVNLVARGVKQGKKRYQNPFQLFQPLVLSWRGRSDLQTLTQVEVSAPAFLLKANAAICGLYLNELLVRLLPSHEPEQPLFHAYQYTLQQLTTAEVSHEVTLRLFEKALLMQLGYGLQLDVESESGQPVRDELKYIYQPDKGLIVEESTARQHTISGRSLRKLAEETDFDQQSLQEIKQLMRTVINYYLGGRPLQSRTLFAQLKQYSN